MALEIRGYLNASKAKATLSTTEQPQMAQPTQMPGLLPEAPHTGEILAPPRSSFRENADNRSISSTRSSFFEDIKHEVMVNYLHQQQCSHLWVSDGSGECEGIMLRKARNDYLSCPSQLVKSTFGHACAELNVQSAMTVNSRVIKTFLAWSPDAIDVPLMNGLRVQVLPCIADLTRARKHQFAAFLASEGLLVVWDDDASNLITRAKAIESELMQFVWQVEAGEDPSQEKGFQICEQEIDAETCELKPEDRPTNLLNTILVAFTLVIVVTLLGLGCRSVAIEVAVDHSYLRLAFLALIPVQIFFTLVCVCYTLERPTLTKCSSSHKLLSAASHSASVPSDKCSSIRNTTQPIVLHVFAIAPFRISRYNVQFIRKGFLRLSHQQSSPSKRQFRHMSCRVGLRTCS